MKCPLVTSPVTDGFMTEVQYTEELERKSTAASDVDAASPEAQLSGGPAASWLKKVQARADDLRRYFEIEPTEILIDEFFCALRKRILLQGRMYVFDHYICFYCNLFGFVKKKAIPIKDIVSVKKKTHMRFPNSIEIETVHGTREFFTSFLNRDDAFRLIHHAWYNGDSGRALTRRKTERPHSIDSNATDSASHSPRYPDTVPAAGAHSRSFYTSAGGALMDSSTFAMTSGDALSPDASESGYNVLPTPGRQMSLGETAKTDDDDECDQEDSEEDFRWTVYEEPAPPIHKDSKPLMRTTLPGSVREVFDRIWGNNSHFVEDFHESQGDRRIKLSEWRPHEVLGHVRDVNFLSPIRSAFASWGTSHAQCYQTQRFAVYKGDWLVIETSQTMADIPCGDCFSVEVRWDIQPDAAAMDPTRQVTVQLHIRVPFTKRTMVKRVIESGSYKQCLEQYTAFIERARHVMQAHLAASAAFAEPDLSPTPFTEQQQMQMQMQMKRTGSQPSDLSGAGVAGSERLGSTAARRLSIAGPEDALPALAEASLQDYLDVPMLQPMLQQPSPGRSSHLRNIPDSARRLISSATRSTNRTVAGWLQALLGIRNAQRPVVVIIILLAVLVLAHLALMAVVLGRHSPGGSGGGAAASGSYSQPGQMQQQPLPANAFWAGRVQRLENELRLLQEHMQTVSRELTAALQHLNDGGSLGGGACSNCDGDGSCS